MNTVNYEKKKKKIYIYCNNISYHKADTEVCIITN